MRDRDAAVVIGRTSNFLDLHTWGRAPLPDFEALRQAAGARLVAFDPETFCAGRLLTRLCLRDPYLGSAIEVLRQRRGLGAVFAVGEQLGLRLAVLLRLARWRGRLVSMVHSSIRPNRKRLLRAVGHAPFHRLVCVSGAQRRILVEELGFPAGKVALLYNGVDTDFFTPVPAVGLGVIAVGLESRDYATLGLAARTAPELDFTLVASGFPGTRSDAGVVPAPNLRVLPEWIDYCDLRDRYAAAAVVVVPLHRMPYAAGVTSIMEAMAMGKPVVVSDSPGIAEYVQDGVSGLVVPAGDPASLAAALRALCADPGRCAAMGRRNRAWVEAHATLGDYARRAAALMG